MYLQRMECLGMDVLCCLGTQDISMRPDESALTVHFTGKYEIQYENRTSACVQTRVHSLCTSPASTKFSMRTSNTEGVFSTSTSPARIMPAAFTPAQSSVTTGRAAKSRESFRERCRRARREGTMTRRARSGRGTREARHRVGRERQRGAGRGTSADRRGALEQGVLLGYQRRRC
eukprot:jgi/Antlo1/1313/385